MGDSEANTTKNQEGLAPAYIENQSAVYTPVVQRSQREGLMKKSQVVLRTIGFVFSVLSFVIMASNRHGSTTDGVLYYSDNFNDYDAYSRYFHRLHKISGCAPNYRTLYWEAHVIARGIELRGFYWRSDRGIPVDICGINGGSNDERRENFRSAT
ncbi:hypothetical protein NE237_002895 [Protea cynaroides]|uniref:CASP-like protein n=1 Tax=Protea cynaroides TaxID=273540 RepID=A0A9Q0KGC5_9MAGN|nr:hypothetical protein NE237_002895 [Protea cynaroides]